MFQSRYQKGAVGYVQIGPLRLRPQLIFAVRTPVMGTDATDRNQACRSDHHPFPECLAGRYCTRRSATPLTLAPQDGPSGVHTALRTGAETLSAREAV